MLAGGHWLFTTAFSIGCWHCDLQPGQGKARSIIACSRLITNLPNPGFVCPSSLVYHTLLYTWGVKALAGPAIVISGQRKGHLGYELVRPGATICREGISAALNVITKIDTSSGLLHNGIAVIDRWDWLLLHKTL